MWPRKIASGLAAAGLLRRYVTTLAFGRRRSFPGSGMTVRGKLRSRAVPDGLTQEQVACYRSAFEVYYLARDRLPGGRLGSDRRLWRRSIRFGEAAAASLEAGDGTVLASFGSALPAFRHGLSLGVKRVLDYPIVHHRHLSAVVSEEAEREPDFAVTLQGQRFPEELTERLDEEIELADRILTLSPAHAESFIRAGIPEDRLIVAPLGVESQLFLPQRASRNANDPFRVVFVGQVTQRKGLSYILEAFETAFGAAKGAELLLVGPIVGSSSPWRRSSSVRHIPSVARSALPAIYAEADVFVMPSLAEGFAQTPLEAMSCGLPVVVSDVTFGESVIEHGVDGFIVPLRDSDAIAQVLMELHTNRELRERVGKRARERSLDFSWDRFQAQMTAEVAELLSAGPEITPGRPED